MQCMQYNIFGAQDFAHAFQNMVLDRIRAGAAGASAGAAGPPPHKQTPPPLGARDSAAAAHWPAPAGEWPGAHAATPPPFGRSALLEGLNARQASAGRAAGWA
jgi:hypothetical protein